MVNVYLLNFNISFSKKTERDISPTLYHPQQNIFNPKKWQILPKRNTWVRYLDMCSVNPAFHKLIKDFPSIIGCEPIRTFWKIVFAKSAPFVGKDFFAALGS